MPISNESHRHTFSYFFCHFFCRQLLSYWTLFHTCHVEARNNCDHGAICKICQDGSKGHVYGYDSSPNNAPLTCQYGWLPRCKMRRCDSFRDGQGSLYPWASGRVVNYRVKRTPPTSTPQLNHHFLSVITFQTWSSDNNSRFIQDLLFFTFNTIQSVCSTIKCYL